ncbi:MAG: ribosomal protein S18-alanine N-acetyltransferase [Gemmatimonadota bacterium]
MNIRPAVAADLESIIVIESQSFSNPWQPDTFRSLLEQERAKVLVAEDPAGGVVGFTILWWVLEQAELANLAVRKDHQRRGIGSILLDSAIAHAESQGVESLFLEVRVSNEPAYRLYSHRGFSQISVRKDYYQNPREDARILVRQLTPASGTHGRASGVSVSEDSHDHVE